MRFRYLLTATLLSAAPLVGASAEPQILGLIAQNEAIQLNCKGGECFAEFSSFCMEPGRYSPGHETAYHPAEGADLTLVVASTDGGERRLPVGDFVTFESIRGYATVRVSVPAGVVEDLGAARIALKVGERVSLLPVPGPNYRRPHEPEEIAVAMGPHRALGERIVDKGGARADAALLISRLLNALPEWGRVSREVRDGVWDEAIEAARLKERRGGGMTVARRAYDVCRAKDPEDTLFTFRQCLEGRHDYLVWSLNRKYWISVGGS